MHVAWSYCQAARFVDKRKTNKQEQFKKEESAGGGEVQWFVNGELVGDRA